MTSLDRYIFNVEALTSVLAEVVSETPKDITLEEMDAVGAITTKVIPNIAKIKEEVLDSKEALVAELTAGKDEFINSIGVRFNGTHLTQADGAPIPGVIGMNFRKTNIRQRSSGALSELTCNYVKKSDTSVLRIDTYMFGEVNGHDTSMRCTITDNDGIVAGVADGNHGQSTSMFKIDDGGYYNHDTNSTPGLNTFIGVVENIPKGNIQINWSVAQGTLQLNGSWGGSWEASTSCVIITEVEI